MIAFADDQASGIQNGQRRTILDLGYHWVSDACPQIKDDCAQIILYHSRPAEESGDLSPDMAASHVPIWGEVLITWEHCSRKQGAILT